MFKIWKKSNKMLEIRKRIAKKVLKISQKNILKAGIR